MNNVTFVYLSFGSNLGDRRSYLSTAKKTIQDHHAIQIVASSSVYESEPWGMKDGTPWFLNECLSVRTTLSPRILLEFLKQVEIKLGRVSKGKYQSRTIDIDILLYGEQCITSPELEVPHPRLAERRFVLVPLLEIAPLSIDPRTNILYQTTLEHLTDQTIVKKYEY